MTSSSCCSPSAVRATSRKRSSGSYAAGLHPHLQQGNYWNSTIYGVNGMRPDLQQLFVSKDKEYADSIKDYFPHVQESMYWRDQLWSLPFNLDADLPYTNLNHVRAAGLQPLKLGYTWDDLVELRQDAPDDARPRQRDQQLGLRPFRQLGELPQSAQASRWRPVQQRNDQGCPQQLGRSGGVAVPFRSVHKHQLHRPHNDWFEANGKDRPSFTNGQVTMFYETSHVRIIAHGEAIGGLENFYISPPPSEEATVHRYVRHGCPHAEEELGRDGGGLAGIALLTSTGPAAVWCSAALFVPARRSILTDPLWVQRMEQVPQYLPFLEAVNYGFRPYHPVFFPEHYSVLRGIIGDVTKTPNVAFKTNLDEAARSNERAPRQLQQDREDLEGAPVGGHTADSAWAV